MTDFVKEFIKDNQNQEADEVVKLLQNRRLNAFYRKFCISQVEILPL